MADTVIQIYEGQTTSVVIEGSALVAPLATSAASSAAAAEAAAAAASSSVPIGVIGPETPATGGASADARTRYHNRKIDFDPAGAPTVTIGGGPSGGTIQLKRATYNETTGLVTQVGPDFPVVVPANDEIEVLVDFVPERDQILGFYGPAGAVANQGIGDGECEALTLSSSTNTNVTSFTDTETTLSQMAIKWVIPRSVRATVAELTASVAALALLATVPVVIGPDKVVPSNGATSARVRGHPIPIKGFPVTTLKVTAAGGLNGGVVAIKRFTKSGNTWTQVGADIPIQVPAQGVTEQIDTGVIPGPGEYLFVYHGTGALALGPAPFPCRYEDTSGNNVRSFTAAATTGTTAPQIRFEYGIAQSTSPEFAIGGWTCIPVYGQSLSIGSQGQPAISLVQPYQNLTFIGGVKATTGADVAATKPLVEDDKTEDAGAGGVHGETVCSSMANHLVRLAAANDGIDPADLVIFSFTGGHGGAAIAELQKGTAYFTRIVNQVTAAKALADAAHKKFVVPYIAFLQGESDAAAGSTELAYRIALEQLQVELEVAIQAITGQTSRVHLVLYQCGNLGSATPKVGGPALAQLHASNDSDVIHCVTPTYHIGRAADGEHMTNQQYIRLGHHLGRAGYQLFKARKPSNMRALSVTAEGTTAWIHFSAPLSPAAVDAINLASTTDNGLKIYDDTGTLTLTLPTMLADDVTLQVTLHRALGANPKCRIAMDYLAPSLAPMNGGASANFHDSTGDTYKAPGGGSNVPLWYVAMADQLDVAKLAEAA